MSTIGAPPRPAAVVGPWSMAWTSPPGRRRMRPPSIVTSAAFVCWSRTTALIAIRAARAITIPIRIFQRRFTRRPPSLARAQPEFVGAIGEGVDHDLDVLVLVDPELGDPSLDLAAVDLGGE